MRTIAQAKQTARGILAVGTALVALLVTLPMAGGCGGGSKSTGGSSVSKARGGLSFTVQWPEKSRVIPLAAESIRITLERIVPGPTLQPVPTVPLLTRANDGVPPPTDADNRVRTRTVTNLELGTYRITATAYPEDDGTGTPLAVAVVDKEVTPTNQPVTVVMEATVARVEVTPPTGPALFVGRNRQFAVTMYDASDNVVLHALNAVAWSSSNEAVATVSTDGLAVITGPGTATIRATYREPGTPVGAEGTGDFGEATVVGMTPTVPWGKFHGDNQNTGKARFGEPTSGSIKWERSVNNSIVFSSPAVDEDGSVYVGAYDGRVYAFTATGEDKWVFDPGIGNNAFDASPAIGPDGTIYIGDYAGNMYAIDRETGTNKWAAPFATTGSIAGSASVVNGVVYFGSTDGDTKLYAVNATTGVEVWSRDLGTGLQTCPAFSHNNNTLYIGGLDGNLYSIDVATGNVIWARQTGDEIFSSSPAVGPNGFIYVGSLNGNLSAFDAAGNVVPGFPVQTGTPIYATPAINVDGGAVTLYFGTYDSLTDLFDHRLFAVNGLTGNVIWSVPFSDGITSSAAIGGDGTIYVGCFDGNVYALNPDSSMKWPSPVNVGDNIESSPAIGADGTIFIGDFGGRFVAIQ